MSDARCRRAGARIAAAFGSGFWARACALALGALVAGLAPPAARAWGGADGVPASEAEGGAAIAEPMTVAVGPLTGPGAGEAREALRAALTAAGQRVLALEEVDRVAAAERRRNRRLRPVASSADLLITGVVRNVGGASVADLKLEVDRPGGVRRVRMRGRTPEELAERLVRWLGRRLPGFVIVSTEPEPEPEPEPEVLPEPELPPVPELRSRRVALHAPDHGPRIRALQPEDPHAVRWRNILDLESTFGVLTRSLTYRDDLFGRVRNYRLGGAPALTLRSRVFPFTRGDRPFLRDLGLESELQYALVTDSERADGQRFPTQASSWSLNLAYRLPLGPHRVRFSLGYGVHGFTLDPSGPASPTNDPRPELPRVRYQNLRAGVGVVLAPIGGLLLHLRAAYMAVLDAGGISSEVWFPNARATGMEWIGGVGYRIGPSLELRGLVEYRRYAFHLNPSVGDANIVGGASDQYVLYTLGVAFVR